MKCVRSVSPHGFLAPTVMNWADTFALPSQ